MGINKGIYFIFGMATICLFLAFLAGNAHAEEQTAMVQQTSSNVEAFTAKHTDPAHHTIMKQLAAIKARNAGEAFSLTTETMHERYKSAGNFLGHMRFEFRSLYNHTEYKFLDQHQIKDGLVQKVEITPETGEPVLAIFKLKKIDDSKWLIDSFTIIGRGDLQPI